MSLDVYMVKGIGIRSRKTNNIVERLHETVKERTRPMRGFKNQDSARAILGGYVVNYNFARPHLSLKGKTPAEQAGIEVKGWKNLIENAIQKEALQPQSQERISIAPVQVVTQ
jgi:transposase-like protein